VIRKVYAEVAIDTLKAWGERAISNDCPARPPERP